MKTCLGRQPNVPCVAKFHLHLKKITPLNRHHDPYLFALLLTITSEQQQKQNGLEKPRLSFWVRYSAFSSVYLLIWCIESPVLMTNCEDKFINLYITQISATVLDMFNEPKTAYIINARTWNNSAHLRTIWATWDLSLSACYVYHLTGTLLTYSVATWVKNRRVRWWIFLVSILL